MTDQEFIYELTKPIEKCFLLSFLEHEERICNLSKEPQFRLWLEKETASGASKDDEWYLYSGETELDKELGSRISWFAGLSTEENRDVTPSGDIFATVAQPFMFEKKIYWICTCFGQGAVSWIMTDEAFEREYKKE